MPLLISPIDGSPMRQIHRYGIEIDVCTTSGGVWLDKGELEKVMHMLKEEAAVEQSNSPPARFDVQNDSNDDQRYESKGYYGSGKYHKKEGTMSRIMDLFDF